MARKANGSNTETPNEGVNGKAVSLEMVEASGNDASSTTLELADFETAIAHTGYGKFNYLLILSGALGTWTIVYETTTMSYVLPSAECDLELSNFDKGVLNAAVYAGMISSAFLWGYLSDTFGRRKLLAYGFSIEATLIFLSSLSPMFWVLAIFKFFGGFITCCPFAVVVTYIAEMNSMKHRARATMIVGIYNATGIVTLPALAWLLIPRPWSWNFLGITFNSWRLFIMVTALPAFLAGLMILYFDESPKFLMVKGRRDEALRVFRRIYNINTGLHPDTYPVKSLAEEIKNPEESPPSSASSPKGVMVLLERVYAQIKPFFTPPLLSKTLLILGVQFGAAWGLNTIRLWMPQLFAIVEEYETIHLIPTNVSESPKLCEMLEQRTNGYLLVGNETTAVTVPKCEQMVVHDATYLYSIIVGMSALCCNAISSFAVNLLGKKQILTFGYLVACASVMSIYWSTSMVILLVVASVFVGSGSMCINSLTSIVVEFYPTNLRTMSVSLTIMIGRIGALVGNLTFPVFLGVSCGFPFFLTSAISFVCAVIGLALPKAMGKPLQ